MPTSAYMPRGDAGKAELLEHLATILSKAMALSFDLGRQPR